MGQSDIELEKYDEAILHLTKGQICYVVANCFSF